MYIVLSGLFSNLLIILMVIEYTPIIDSDFFISTVSILPALCFIDVQCSETYNSLCDAVILRYAIRFLYCWLYISFYGNYQ
jgi:hypothetical protein